MKQRGFSLIELMVVVAIIGILATLAVPAFRSYVRSANIAKVSSHYDEGVRYVRNDVRRMHTEFTLGTGGGLGSLQKNTLALLRELNQHSGSSPIGTAAYAAARDDAVGVVGVSVSNLGTTSYRVRLERPAYESLSLTSEVVAWGSL